MKSFARILSVFLSMLMVLYLVPAEVYSLKTSATEPAIDKIVSTDNVLSTETAEVAALGEDISKRTASTKTIRMSDGSYRLVQYANEVHYEKGGEWIEYDNSLSLSASENAVLGGVSTTETPAFTTASNPGGLKFGQSTADKVLSFADGNKKLEMSINGASKNSTIVPLTQAADLEPADKWEELITIENYSSSVMYSNVFNNAHIRYTTAGNQVKEDIIVFKKADSYSYDFNFTLTGLDAEMQADGSIIFKDETTDEMMYYIPTGYMYDSDGDTSTEVSYSLTQTATGCTVTVTADAEWINSTERSFPVVIDPTLVKSNSYLYNSIRDVDVHANQTYYSAWQAPEMHVGVYNGISYDSLIGVAESGESGSDAVDLFNIPENSVVTSAKLELYAYALSGQTTVTLHAITSDWDHKALKSETKPSYRSTVVDYQKITASGKNYSFDFTSLAHEWFEQENATSNCNRGLLLKTTDNTYVCFATVNYLQNTQMRPAIIISYRDTKGLDGRWTYANQSAGGAGSGSVNLFTGNLVFVHGDIATNGNIHPLAVSHVYNGSQIKQQFTFVEGDIHTADYSNMTVGYGFKLSIQETIIEKSIDGETWYVYNDADGTELYFNRLKDEDGNYISNVYYSEDGLDLTIIKSGGVYTMEDKVGNTKKFVSNGMLTEIADLHGNKKTITYVGGRVSSVTHTPAGGTAKTQLTFTYNSAGALQKITNSEDTGEYVTFSYSTTYNGTVSANNAGYLRTVTHSKGTGSCTYEYFASGRLKYAIDTATGNKLVYQYSNGKVDSVSEYNASSVMGQKVGFIYGVETTAVRTSGNDDVYGNTDDLLAHYVFDDHGRTISAYSTNLAETEVYGASNAEYSPTVEFSKKNHTVTKEGASGVPAINLLANPSMEYSTNWTASATTNYSAAQSDADHLVGEYAYKLYSTSASGNATVSQTVAITKAGNYTLSAYVKLENVTGTVGVYAKLDNTISRKYNGTTAAGIQNGWQRISVTANLAVGNHTVSFVLQNATGTAYVDCIQLEKGDGTSEYNLLANGNFMYEGVWNYSSNSYRYNIGANNWAAQIRGNHSTAPAIRQTIPLNRPITSTFVISGWASANSVALNTADRTYGIKVTLNYSDDSSEDTFVSFSSDNTGKQFASGAVVSTKTDTSLKILSATVSLCYGNNANLAQFQNICLAMEPAQTYSYDSEGNLTSATNADGNKVDAEYAGNQIDLESYTSIIGETYTYEYNSKHMVTESTRTGTTPITTTYSYDQYGNQTAEVVTNANGSLSVSAGATYDSYGKTLTVTDSRGNDTVYSYDNYTELLQYVQTANNARTAYVYDNKDRITSIYNDIDRDGVKDQTEHFVSYTYNGKNQLTGIQTDNTLYTLTYDSFGNSSSVKAGNYTLASYTYNSKNGKLMGTTYGNGFTVTNVYDLLDRLVAVKYNNNVAYTVTYNGSGAVSCISDVLSGRSTDYEYDSLGRLIRAEQYITATGISLLKTENGYDTYGRAKSSKYQVNGKTQSYSVLYQNSSNLISSFNSYLDGDEWLNTEFTYDSLERLTTECVNLNGFSKTESYEYLTTGTATTSLVSAHIVDGVRYTYTYDSVGNIISVYKNGALKYFYTYDKLGQLTEATVYSDNYSTDYVVDVYTYFYDKSGNITSVTHTYGADANNVDTVQYGYGDASWGDLLTSYNGTAITYDAIGNPLKWRNATNIEWSGRQLTLFGASNGEVYTYTYNADGIRTSKTVYNAGGGLTGIVEYIYDGTKLIAESRSGDWLYYFYDANGAVTGMSYNGTLYYFRKNLQGDVTGIYNASGNIIAQYEYTPYGALLSTTGSMASTIGAVNPFRYRGYYYDTETGFYYLQSRYYDPVVGRFINADVIIGANGGIEGYNSFAYCNNNPVMKYDPTGYDAIIIHETDSANTAGHTGLIVQAENGQWYYFYWGPKNENDYIGMTTVGVKKKCVMLPLELGDIKTIDDIKTAMSNSDYAFIRDRADLTTHHVYLEGDYTNTFEYLRALRISKTKYHLINFNCAIVTYKALATSNPFFRFLSPTSHVFNIVPDMSFGKVKTFDTMNRAFDAGLEYLKTRIDVVSDGVKSFWKKLFY